jgi:hypothetical protein
MVGSKRRSKGFYPLALAAIMALFASGCLSPLVGGEAVGEPPPALPERWEQMAAAAIRVGFPEAQPKILFLGRPRPAKVRYRYWTDKRLSGLAGLAVLKSREVRGKLLGPDGPWFALYVIGPEGEVDLVTDNLEATDVDPPIYSMTVVDVSKGSEIRLPRPLDLSRDLWRELGEFSRTPWEELPDWR